MTCQKDKIFEEVRPSYVKLEKKFNLSAEEYVESISKRRCSCPNCTNKKPKVYDEIVEIGNVV